MDEGQENARTAQELSSVTGLRRRGISRAIEAARRAGVPVCASTDTIYPGYFLPSTPDELNRYIRSLQGRVSEVSATLESVKQGGRRWFEGGGGG